jgi:hypothetical protein
MKTGILLLVVGFMAISCASFKAAYEDEAIIAELAVDDNDGVVLTIKQFCFTNHAIG